MMGSNIDNGGGVADGPPQGFALACVSRVAWRPQGGCSHTSTSGHGDTQDQYEGTAAVSPLAAHYRGTLANRGSDEAGHAVVACRP